MIVGFIHSTRLVLPWIEEALAPFGPRARFLHALDEALIVELAKGQGVTHGALRRITFMAESLADAGAERVVLSCSSLSPAVDTIAPNLEVPFIKVDEAAIRAMILTGKPFVVVATNPSTTLPINLIVEAVAVRLGKKPIWHYELLAGAFEALNRGDADSHDAAVTSACETIAAAGSGVFLAQISMARIVPRLSPAGRAAVRTSLDYLEETTFGKADSTANRGRSF